MTRRGSTVNLILSLVAYGVLMVILLVAVGFGVGTFELVIWLVLLVAGIVLIVRRFRRARALTDETTARAR